MKFFSETTYRILSYNQQKFGNMLNLMLNDGQPNNLRKYKKKQNPKNKDILQFKI